MTPDSAQAIALQALAHIVSDEAVRPRFFELSGLSGNGLRQAAQDPELLAGVLDFILAHESLLTGFCKSAAIAPEQPARARALLPGAVLL
ncbi:MAG: DUF3572 domain-containing protein [Alphaproteobacteria bacterium]|jgi:hypothetical protein|nr:DUF3572 domain-containing protein [Alphaproteobacteria bacterium]MDP6238077.1 DUF3572 domain-containing protein [Alphaproteobacteria bacterium]MDP7172188.1 DUF3572 domain-containing protein [Alphaproteobacteria bacterium]MDP7232891.1 DUF3572 domain-containing protein [Alphaproteobacteria bacterium]MDP7487579.1 DUF3572 domain-containing protein [Alphaproteobacteria bacterium]|tara:strand:+ start:1419 stop:1688 length:270 start_codon:yes stop_codon:yes gene_type:complete